MRYSQYSKTEYFMTVCYDDYLFVLGVDVSRCLHGIPLTMDCLASKLAQSA